MACNCSDLCSCIIQGGEGIAVQGSGTVGDPFVVSREGSDVVINVEGSPTLSLSITGSGLPSDPFNLTGEATVRMTELSDVDDTAGPGVGDVPVWTGSAWQFSPPPTVPPGAVNTVPGGLVGDGSFGDPLGINVSNTTESSLDGLETYIDSAEELRVVPPTPVPTDWSDITSKPGSFPPSSHTHPFSQITGTVDADTVGGRSFFAEETPPTSGDGVDGDVWFELE